MPVFPFRPPATLTLAADARVVKALPADEHIWTLHAAHGLPEALALTTTYGLRVQDMAIFPWVEMEGQPRWKVAAFAGTPQVEAILPAYARLTCKPFGGLALTCEYWVGHPQAVTGRLTVRNDGGAEMRGALGLAALLRPLEVDGGGMAPVKRGAVHILQGEGGGLHPLLFLTGGAEGVLSPFPALLVPFALSLGEQRRLTWVHTALDDAEAGFELARQLAARRWEPFFARLMLLDAQTPALEVGEPSCTWMLARARQTAHQLVQHVPDLPAPFLVTARTAEHGGPTDPLARNRAASVLAAYHLAVGYFLPTQPAVVQDWVRAFLARQREDGSIPWQPALGEEGYLASPLLVELAYRAFEHDAVELPRLYAPLRRFVEQWYATGDVNRDGFPEWAHPLQMGLPDPPAFSPWRRESVGSDLSLAESPALYALLYRALTRLEALAEAAGEEPPPDLRSRQRRLLKAVQAMWDARRRTALYRDRDTHERPPHLTLGKHRGGGTLTVAETFALPTRVVVHLFPVGGEVRPAVVTVQGSDERGKPVTETLRGGRIRWHEGRGVAVTQAVFHHLAAVTVEGLRSRGRFVVLTPDYTFPDISLVLPLWAKMLEPSQAEAVRRALSDERMYGRPYGVPVAPRGGQRAPDWQRAVLMPWNTLAVEALLAQGWVSDAARLLGRLGGVAEKVLRAQGVFREAYHADQGEGMEGKDGLVGLPPVGLWLRVAGVEPVDPRRVRFLWPMPFDDEWVIRFWGWEIRRRPGRTLVVTPDGATHTMTATEPYEVVVE